MATRILLVDDDELFVEALRICLDMERPDWEVISASDGREALEVLRRDPVDLMVTDLLMPSLDGMGLISAVRSDPRLAQLPLILITGRDDRSTMREGMSSGADDFLAKPFLPAELIRAIEARLRRLAPAPAPDPEEPALDPTLTERERQILSLIGLGHTTKQIAAQLALSPNTVSVHRANLMRKLNLHNAPALAALAVKARLS